jgi:hypothetical protein
METSKQVHCAVVAGAVMAAISVCAGIIGP